MNVEGSIRIRLQPQALGPRRVGIESTRPQIAARLLEGRTVAEALRLLPRVFSVCGMAQAAAGARACASALGETPAPEAERNREQAVAVESLREHLWRIVLDWPIFLDRPVDRRPLSEMLAVQQAWQAATGDDWRHPGRPDAAARSKLQARLRCLLTDTVFGMPPERWLALSTPDELAVWLEPEPTLAAAMLAAVIRRGWAGIGQCEVPSLPADLEPARVQARLADPAFMQRPEWEGRCRETSTFTRTRTPLLAALRAQHGNGLLPRLVARLSEMAQLCLRLENEADPPLPVPPSGGIGEAAAARGRLIHAVQVDGDGRVCRYRILAPTDWNFHPHGVVAQALAELDGDADLIAEQTRQIVQAIDPCVGYELTLAPAPESRLAHA